MNTVFDSEMFQEFFLGSILKILKLLWDTPMKFVFIFIFAVIAFFMLRYLYKALRKFAF